MLGRINAVVNRQTGQIIVQTPLAPINCISLEGGGSRCAGYPGFYKVLHRCGLMREVDHIAGSSGGAICALAIALGYEPEAAEAIMMDLNMERFLEGRHSWLSSSGLYAKGRLALSILNSTTYSLSSGNEFLRWLESIVEKRLGKKDATFADLAALIKEQGADSDRKLKYLYVTGTNLSLALPECEYFSHETTPDMPLALSVRISASFPFVFDPVMWNGKWYSDGGLIRVLPTKIFDDARFLPPGYHFTEKGVNPGVLAVKVDSQDEIDQVLWGIAKEVELKSASEVMSALYNALSQNTDTDEIREARMTIALPDNNIGVLDFSVNQDGKISLISTAERVTQDFVDNHFNGAYDIKVYAGIRAWLDALSLEEIDDVIAIYENMRLRAVSATTYPVISHALISNPVTSDPVISDPVISDQTSIVAHTETDPNHPSIPQLQAYIRFLESYFNYRRMIKRYPQCQFDLKVPDQHINISPYSTERGNWFEYVEKELRYKLNHVSELLEILEGRIIALDHEFTELPDVTDKTPLHDPEYFENIQALTTLIDYRRVLFEEKKDLEIKLGIFDKSKVNYLVESSQRYAVFMKKLDPVINSNSIPPELKALRFDHYPIVMYASSGYTQRGIGMLDLHDEQDRKLYIISALLFLTYKKSRHKKLLIDLYGEFVSADLPLPKNLKELGAVTKVKGLELYVMAYRLEELLHYFEYRFNPKETPSVQLDTLFSARLPQRPKKATTTENPECCVPMRHIVRVHSIFSTTDQSSPLSTGPSSSRRETVEELAMSNAKSYYQFLSRMSRQNNDNNAQSDKAGAMSGLSPGW